MTPTASSPAPTPLTADQSRHRWQVYDAAPDRITWLLTPLGTSGGLWFDDSLGTRQPVLHIASTEPLPASVTTHIAALLDGEPVVYQRSPVTEAYLLGVLDEITTSGLWDSLHISQAGTDVVTSTVEITIPTTSPPATEHLLRSRLGPHLRIIRSDFHPTAAAARATST